MILQYINDITINKWYYNIYIYIDIIYIIYYIIYLYICFSIPLYTISPRVFPWFLPIDILPKHPMASAMATLMVIAWPIFMSLKSTWIHPEVDPFKIGWYIYIYIYIYIYFYVCMYVCNYFWIYYTKLADPFHIYMYIYISVDGYICFSMGQLNSFSLSLKVDPFKIQSKLLVFFN